MESEMLEPVGGGGGAGVGEESWNGGWWCYGSFSLPLHIAINTTRFYT